MSSGVTGGYMYSGVFKQHIADLYHTTVDQMPGWKVVRDTIMDPANIAVDEWWSAAIGRNFIVLYENAKVLRLVAAWHRVEGTDPRNERIERLQHMRTDMLSDSASDTMEVSQFKAQLELPDVKRQLIHLGNVGRARLNNNSITIGRHLLDLRLWVAQSVLAEGNALFEANAVHNTNETRFGIWHAEVDNVDNVDSASESESRPSDAQSAVDDATDDSSPLTAAAAGNGQPAASEVDMLFRHNNVVRVSCTCEEGQNGEICKHIVAAALQVASHFKTSVRLPDLSGGKSVGARGADNTSVDSERYQHYADAVSMLHQVQPTEPRFEALTAFITSFKEPPEPLHRVEFMAVDAAGSHRIGYSVYSEVVLSFIEAVLHDSDDQYTKVLHRYGLDKDVSLDILNTDHLDDTLIVALLTMLVYKERRNEGVIAEALEDGSLVRLLERLRDVDSSRGTKEDKAIRRKQLQSKGTRTGRMLGGLGVGMTGGPIGPRGLSTSPAPSPTPTQPDGDDH
ncbi:SWIM zinc finger domain protein [Bifidobacterium gallicum DSM 20093 = LMG 11596]|uniref:SWIM zinc finger domain protein n=2 Tax=Bifidobacterium gallicum DSM 20093 = LMG 11596 TaxID=561180 RepID=D1NU32_9BIFI|nr:SWIM zinc finger domain protein [Bifidobacterium gallicum DSM 20093 = LMG 11596]